MLPKNAHLHFIKKYVIILKKGFTSAASAKRNPTLASTARWGEEKQVVLFIKE